MSVKVAAPDESALIAEWIKTHSIKRHAPGDSSNWDARPYRQRHAERLAKAKARKIKGAA